MKSKLFFGVMYLLSPVFLTCDSSKSRDVVLFSKYHRVGSSCWEREGVLIGDQTPVRGT